MLKLVSLKLSKIKYSGDSVGRDIRVETEILGQFSNTNKRIKAGTIVEINKEVARFETDKNFLAANIKITVIEKDLLFNDVGNVSGKIKINTAVQKQEQFKFKVEVKEVRLFGFWGKRIARFEVILDAQVEDSIKYVIDDDEAGGWVKVLLEYNQSKEESLPAYLKVKIEHADNKKEYFTILEGPHRGRLASVEIKKNEISWFISGVKHEPMVRAKYSIFQKTFILKGKKYRTVDYPKAQWKKGIYDIEIPDYPHGGGRGYLGQSKRALTWFRIGHGGERYLHAGGISLGCMTIVEIKRWMEIYNVLIKARKGDSMSVGELEVVD